MHGKVFIQLGGGGGGGGVYRNLVVYRNLDVSVLAILIFMSWCVFS
jgi:hypothetical protein